MEYVKAKTIVNRTRDNWWFGTDYGMNIYRGCSFGCIYCDSRSDCYGVENFDRVRAKEDALRIIRDDLRKKTKRGVIHTGSMSDPYTTAEKPLKLMRNALELINAFHFGVCIATKSPLVVRDIDILQDIQTHSPVIVSLSITALEDHLSGKIELNAPPSSERFQALKALADAGIYCGILLMPVIPYMTDSEENILGIVRKAAQCGAKYVHTSMGMSLRDGQREHFYEKIGPQLEKIYQERYNKRYQCQVPESRKLWNAFKMECDRLGLLYKMEDITKDYQENGFKMNQLSLF